MSHYITMQVAGISVRFIAPDNMVWTRTDYRGFAVADTCLPTLSVRIVDLSQIPEPIAEKSNIFVGDCRGTEMPDHRWEVGKLPNAQEYISVEYFTDTLPLVWCRLTYGATEGMLEVVRRNQTINEIEPYIFPLSNILISRLLHRKGGFMIHSSVVNDGGKGYLFTAVSGTGKSTMARLWQSEGSVIVNDDMLAICTDQERITASNIPMNYYIDTPRTVALNGIFLISQSKTNFIRPISGAIAALRLASNTISQPSTQQEAIEHMQSVSNVAQRVPIFELGFKPDTDIVAHVRSLNL